MHLLQRLPVGEVQGGLLGGHGQLLQECTQRVHQPLAHHDHQFAVRDELLRGVTAAQAAHKGPDGLLESPEAVTAKMIESGFFPSTRSMLPAGCGGSFCADLNSSLPLAFRIDTSRFTSSGTVRATMTKRSSWSGVWTWPGSWDSVSRGQPATLRELTVCCKITPESSTMDSCFSSRVCRFGSVKRRALPLMSRAKLMKPVTARAILSAASLISRSSNSRPHASSWLRLTSRRGSGEEELRVMESQDEVEEVEELDAVLIRWLSVDERWEATHLSSFSRNSGSSILGRSRRVAGARTFLIRCRLPRGYVIHTLLQRHGVNLVLRTPLCRVHVFNGGSSVHVYNGDSSVHVYNGDSSSTGLRLLLAPAPEPGGGGKSCSRLAGARPWRPWREHNHQPLVSATLRSITAMMSPLRKASSSEHSASVVVRRYQKRARKSSLQVMKPGLVGECTMQRTMLLWPSDSRFLRSADRESQQHRLMVRSSGSST
ncbi:hypothetical protein CRUP_029374 [Coryphaenoides rupestris]|nr:hypothetical protein CRUP_029374 [Coryphaenoides rupestris]